MPKRRQLALSLVAGAGLLWIASPVVGQPQQEIVVTGKAKIPEGYHAVKRNVSIKGLDLSTPAGAAEMERRVAAAVEWICQSHLAVDKEEQSDSKRCSDFAWASARPQMDRAYSGRGATKAASQARAPIVHCGDAVIHMRTMAARRALWPNRHGPHGRTWPAARVRG